MSTASKIRISTCRLLVCLSAVLALNVVMDSSPAAAASSWWHLTSGARPTYLHSGVAKDEVQQLTIGATTGVFYIASEEEAHPGQALVPYNATHEELQEILEGIYGVGNIEVPKGQGDASGDDPYEIVFTGELADQPIEPMFFYSYLLEGGSEQWSLNVKSEGRADGDIVVTAANLGNAEVSSASGPITITDKLPQGLRAVGAHSVRGQGGSILVSHGACKVESKSVTSCLYENTNVPSYAALEMLVDVVVEEAPAAGELNEASIVGGGTRSASIARPVTVHEEATPFGVEDYELGLEDEKGTPDTQAGSHPFQTTFTFNLSGLGGSFTETPRGTVFPNAAPVALIKDLHVKLPPGLIGNPTPFPQCTLAHFYTETCLPQTVLGVSQIRYDEPTFLGVERATVAVYNLEPSVGEPARFGFIVANIPVFIDSGVRSGEDYGISGLVNNISQEASLLSAETTLWGVPGSPSHDSSRGEQCLHDPSSCAVLGEHDPPPFLSLPTSCTGPLQSDVEVDSWEQPGLFTSRASEPLQSLDGCNRVPFTPQVRATPDGNAGSTPTGLNVDEHVSQASTLDPEGLAEADVKGLSVTLPSGVALNPAAADGLQACSLEQIGLQSNQIPTCPDASKIATVTIRTPLLPNPLQGAAYLATQNANPFGSLVGMYIFAEDPTAGVQAKAAGEVVENETTGQLTAHFEEDPVFSKDPRWASTTAANFLPEVPFEDVELHFFGGDRAPLATPAYCGTYTTNGTFTPWSGSALRSSSSTFEVTQGPNGSPCANPLPFVPSLTAGTTSIQAGGFTPFTMTMSRGDGNQNLQAVELKMPPGLSGTLSTVQLCQEPQADLGTCGPESLIGETIVSVGVGGDPYSVKGGKVYITGPYKGAPFGLSIVNPAKAGPFDLGQVIVRAKVEVDPITAALTITTDDSGPYKIPSILDGIPLQIQHVNVTINRPNFTFNPTNCSKLAVTGNLFSVEGSTSAVSVPFQATNCAVLSFQPHVSASTSGKTSRTGGASLQVKLSYTAGPYDTNISRFKIALPKQLPSRLSTLQKACTFATFQTNPADCPAASMIGHAHATTPLIPVALEGPMYFVSHGGAKFPEVIVVLQGYGVTIDLHGETFISKSGITSSTFATVPDAPVGTFEATLPEGPNSALAAIGNLCKSKPVMPTEIIAQNGAELHQNTPITVTGCKPTAKVVKHKKRAKPKKA